MALALHHALRSLCGGALDTLRTLCLAGENGWCECTHALWLLTLLHPADTIARRAMTHPCTRLERSLLSFTPPFRAHLARNPLPCIRVYPVLLHLPLHTAHAAQRPDNSESVCPSTPAAVENG